MDAKEKRAFLRGMLAALAVVKNHDQSTIYHEIVRTAGGADLVSACDDEQDAVWSGLKETGYWGKHWRQQPRQKPSV